MEHLTRQQIVLLALLVSFVSSIASSIVTVSLTDQGQPTATQTISRVVERTIEKVSPTIATSAARETVIVKDDQAVTDAIARVSRSIVRIFVSNQGVPGAFVGLGVIVSPTGRIVTSSGVLGEAPLVAKLSGGNVVSLVFVSRDAARGLSLFQADQSANPLDARAYSAVAFADSGAVKLGQAVVAVGGVADPVAATGIVSSIRGAGDGMTLKTSPLGEDFDSSAVLANLLGEVVGIQNDSPSDKAFIPSNIIKQYDTTP
ncbi:MAG: serine protease [Candidatus Paceibacterota bacterium]|jgi:hypothetical protein